MIENSELKEGEPHPLAKHALKWIAKNKAMELPALLEACSSCAIEGNREAEIFAGTIERLLTKQPVSDRYLLGLFAWFVLFDNKDGENDYLGGVQMAGTWMPISELWTYRRDKVMGIKASVPTDNVMKVLLADLKQAQEQERKRAQQRDPWRNKIGRRNNRNEPKRKGNYYD